MFSNWFSNSFLTASGAPTMVGAGQPNPGVIHSPSGSQVGHTEEEILSDEEARKRRELLARRPSYRKIFNELSDVEGGLKPEPGDHGEENQEEAATAPPPPLGYNPVIPVGGLNGGLMAGANLLQYAQDPAGSSLLPTSGSDLGLRSVGANSPSLGAGGYSPVHSSASSLAGDGMPPATTNTGGPSTVKRQMRLLKNREAAKECRRKKKEYVKCLENRVAVLENQNKALIEELKTLKELYCRKGD